MALSCQGTKSPSGRSDQWLVSFQNCLGRANDAATAGTSGLQQLAPDSRRILDGENHQHSSTGHTPNTFLCRRPPRTWEVDGRNEFHREYNDPMIGPVFQAGFKNQHTKVVKLAVSLSAEQRQGRVGEEIAKAYRKQIIYRMKAGQLAAAAKQSVEMFEMVPRYVQDVDRRRFNRILKQMDKEGKKHYYTLIDVASPSSQPLFTVVNGHGWGVSGERKLQREQRPNPAFKVATMDGSGTWLLNRSWSSIEQPEVRSVLRRLDIFGRFVGEKPLNHDAYRIGAGATGSHIAIMDSSGILHIYDAGLNVVTETNLQEGPRVVDHFRTIDTNYWGGFKSQVRAVDVASEGDRYLFTLADEAWCCTVTGRTLWGVAMPLKEGWKHVVGRTERFGVGHEVEEALHLFGLSLPVSPTEIKQKYRVLAMAHHPDHNASNPGAGEKDEGAEQGLRDTHWG